MHEGDVIIQNLESLLWESYGVYRQSIKFLIENSLESLRLQFF